MSLPIGTIVAVFALGGYDHPYLIVDTDVDNDAVVAARRHWDGVVDETTWISRDAVAVISYPRFR